MSEAVAAQVRKATSEATLKGLQDQTEKVQDNDSAVASPAGGIPDFDDEFPDGGLRAWMVVFGVCFPIRGLRSC
jgi:hypothetical protein